MHTTKLSVAVLALGALAACHAPKDVSTVSLMALEVKAPGSMFSTGSVVQLEADGFFSNGTRERLTESVSWSSSDE